MSAWLKLRSKRLRRVLRENQLVVALVIAISAALTLTAVSLVIYKTGGYYRYDLSRPGYEKERSEIATSSPEVSFDTTSALTTSAVDGYLKQLDDHRKNLDSYNTFTAVGLTDEDLELTPAAQ